MARFCPLFSGSSGNSYYIGSAEHGVLIDAGKNAKQLTEALQRCEIPVSAVEAIFVTHEHSDHVSGLRVFASRHKIPVYGSNGTMAAQIAIIKPAKKKATRVAVFSGGMEFKYSRIVLLCTLISRTAVILNQNILVDHSL